MDHCQSACTLQLTVNKPLYSTSEVFCKRKQILQGIIHKNKHYVLSLHYSKYWRSRGSQQAGKKITQTMQCCLVQSFRIQSLILYQCVLDGYLALAEGKQNQKRNKVIHLLKSEDVHNKNEVNCLSLSSEGCEGSKVITVYINSEKKPAGIRITKTISRKGHL